MVDLERWAQLLGSNLKPDLHVKFIRAMVEKIRYIYAFLLTCIVIQYDWKNTIE